MKRDAQQSFSKKTAILSGISFYVSHFFSALPVKMFMRKYFLDLYICKYVYILVFFLSCRTFCHKFQTNLPFLNSNSRKVVLAQKCSTLWCHWYSFSNWLAQFLCTYLACFFWKGPKEGKKLVTHTGIVYPLWKNIHVGKS